MDKMRMETPDLTAANVEKIGALFPNCITEMADENGKLKKAINFDLLRQMLSEAVVEGDVVTAYARLLHQGSTLHVWNVDIKDTAGDLISNVRVTNYIVRQK